MMMEDFGARVASVWEGLRPATRSLVERALQTPAAGLLGAPTTPARGGVQYDARADWELSRLLAALDERAVEEGESLNEDQAVRLRRMAETTASVLQNQTQSAEVFAQLVKRAHRARNYARVDLLADALRARFAPSEICELARQPDMLVRILAQEALAQAPISILVALLGDPVDAEIAREAIARQALEYGSDEARQIFNLLDLTDLAAEDV